MFQARHIMRLARGTTFRRTCATAQNEVEPLQEKEKVDAQARYIALLEQYEDKIQFNSKLEALKIKYGPMKLHVMKAREVKEQRHIKYGFKKMHLTQAWELREQRRREYEEKKLPPLPIALRYVVDKERLLKDPEDMEEDIEEEEPVAVYLPYSKVAEIQYTEDPEESKNKKFDKSNINNWMTNYSFFDDTKMLRRPNADDEASDDEEVDLEWTKRYGTPDPNERISRVQCGGCGAFLHCTDTSIPGYVPSEILKHRTEEEMKVIECQRCHFLKHYNIALNVNVHPDEYQSLLLQIANRKALVILMVDLLDFPCSIWPGIIDVIGTQRPLIIVGNKVDLLPSDGEGYLKRVRDSLVNEIRSSPLQQANIKAVSLISAKTGYGVEDLISNLFKNWLYKGDVFLIGCTNVGKSSLFNKLLQSDYCKVHAVDIIHRATVSAWPGTTLNLLKFPINRPSGYKIYTRTKRLKLEANSQAEAELRESKNRNSSNLPSLIGHIGRSFVDESRAQNENDPFTFGGPPDSLTSRYVPQSGIDENREIFRKSRWFYDTPGVVHPDQILPLLTADELLLVVPKSTIVPRSYYLLPGTALFIGGIARFDVVDCARYVRVTVFTSKDLPITTTKIEHADEVYEKFLGTEFFTVPIGGKERLSQWPGLTKHHELITLMGQGKRKSCADVILSSVGWISVTGHADKIVEVEAWTPEARGVHVRTPSMLEQAILLRGKRIVGSPAYNVSPRKLYF